ncbi:MAG: ABC transporter permease [Chelatococcus sp.]|uniref:ABC transporter permease n=1 Tax=unclassified Chelatococcus TaxID=2638111 RepID=UPI001BD00D6F|nr:ABC transporter permease [Chelatococcus sp.]MBS7741967.1 ABC transporter permease [Chelatococcus sp. HY11]CAH1648371.1 ABC transporter permease [Hyphomicrobiales bacterium]MBX3539568.1 ABC transporter permease [Chelatococcus sp.]MBX3541235.1 ABC transporter permease [Chelatococcus sp.]MCO5074872.1 ABC transporter permease [Chelatococcus sp.]
MHTDIETSPLRPVPVAAQAVGQRPVEPKIDLLPIGRRAYGLLITLLYIFLLLPILIIVFASFSPDQRNTYALSNASLHWYREFFASNNFTSAFQFSLWLALVAAVLATIIGFITAYGIVRFTGRGRNLAQSLVMLPMMVPHILISLSLLLLLTVLPLMELSALIIGHVLICLPFTIAGIIASLEGVDPDLEAAAWTLGAPRWRVLIEVTLPLIAPGVLSALIFAFIISFGDVYIALFLSGPGVTTLPVEIFSYIQWESSPVIAAITTLQIVLIVLFGLFVERLVGLRTAMRL